MIHVIGYDTDTHFSDGIFVRGQGCANFKISLGNFRKSNCGFKVILASLSVITYSFAILN